MPPIFDVGDPNEVTESPSLETRNHFPEDQFLRARGYTLEHRPPHAPALWRKGKNGHLVAHPDALVLEKWGSEGMKRKHR